LSVSDGVAFEHEESGDGTWCLYVIDGNRVEVQFRPGDRATLDAVSDDAEALTSTVARLAADNCCPS